MFLHALVFHYFEWTYKAAMQSGTMAMSHSVERGSSRRSERDSGSALVFGGDGVILPKPNVRFSMSIGVGLVL